MLYQLMQHHETLVCAFGMPRVTACSTSGQLTQAHSTGAVRGSQIPARTVLPPITGGGARATATAVVFAVRSASRPGRPRRPPSVHCYREKKTKTLRRLVVCDDISNTCSCWVNWFQAVCWVAANVLHKQSWTADKGLSFSLGVGRGANNFHRKKK
jgi:hypothetical protein